MDTNNSQGFPVYIVGKDDEALKDVLGVLCRSLWPLKMQCCEKHAALSLMFFPDPMMN